MTTGTAAERAGGVAVPVDRQLLPQRERALVLGCAIDRVLLDEAVDAIDARIATRRPCQHVSINAAKLVKFQRDPALRAAIARCELVTADGQSVVWAARMLGQHLPERVAGIDLMHAVLARAGERGYRVFILGARRAVLDEAVRNLTSRDPRLTLAGWHHGYFSPADEPQVVRAIADAEADILFVALETPAKEQFLARHRDVLSIPFVMGVGGAIDIAANKRRRAPRWLQRLGLEWAFRLAQDPRRLARRYAIGNTQFALLVGREALRRRFA